MSDAITTERRDAVTVLRLDDGKANAVSHDLIAGVSEALDQAAKDGGAVAVLGRPGRFSAGFDLSIMSQGPEAAQGLVGEGAELLVRMLQSPVPIVAGCTGHALAMGALLLLASDYRVGTAGNFKLGLNEVAIKMVLPRFAVLLAQDRLSKRHLLRSANHAEIYDPEGACDAGYLDLVVAPEVLESRTLEEAARLAALPRGAFAGTKEYLRGPLATAITASLGESGEWALGNS